jgi:hypothetical protein
MQTPDIGTQCTKAKQAYWISFQKLSKHCRHPIDIGTLIGFDIGCERKDFGLLPGAFRIE